MACSRLVSEFTHVGYCVLKGIWQGMDLAYMAGDCSFWKDKRDDKDRQRKIEKCSSVASPWVSDIARIVTTSLC